MSPKTYLASVDQTQVRPLLARILISPDESRLRAGWRLSLQVSLTLALIAIGLLAVAVLLPDRMPGPRDAVSEAKSGPSAFGLFVQLLAVTASVYLARRFLDRRSIQSLGLRLDRYSILDLLSGITVAGCIFGLVYVVEMAMGWLRFESYAWEGRPPLVVLDEVLNSLVAYTFVGWQEELWFRGYSLVNIAQALNLTWGVLLSSVVYALAHLSSANVSVAAIAGLTVLGLFLAYSYVLTRQLWLPIGLHIGWNFFQGPVFGFSVSGTDHFSLVRQAVEGPEIWTGGAFGPEAGLIVLPGILVGVGLVYKYGDLRGLAHGYERAQVTTQ